MRANCSLVIKVWLCIAVFDKVKTSATKGYIRIVKSLLRYNKYFLPLQFISYIRPWKQKSILWLFRKMSNTFWVMQIYSPELDNGRVVSVLSSVNTVLFYFSSHLISISVVFYSFKKSETICSKRKWGGGFRILP